MIVTLIAALWATEIAAGAGLDEPGAARAFAEARDICERDGEKLWGTSLCGPLLLVDPRSRVAVANQPDAENRLGKSGQVFTGTLPAEVLIANTALQWAGVKWTMLMWPLPEEKYGRATLLGHEMWHRVQDELGFPQSGAANDHLDTREGRAWLQLEWRALAVALGGKGDERIAAVRDALAFRAFRRSLFAAAAEEERAMELHEGLAEYTGVRLSGNPDPGAFVIGNMERIAKGDTLVRSFAYASGPAYGLLLDAAAEDWQRSVAQNDDLGALLAAAMQIQLPTDLLAVAEDAAKKYDGERLFASEAERERRQQAVLAGWRAKLIEGPVLVVPLREMQMQFDPGELVPLPGRGTVYPQIKVVDAWGVLTVTGGALMESDFSRITVPAPKDAAARPLEGDGWRLDLNPSWRITGGERADDLVVERSD